MEITAFRTVPGVPRWAKWAAHAVALVNVPSGIWRLGIAVGIPFGLARSELDGMGAPGWGSWFLLALTLLAEAFAVLTLGLIQPWGEMWPRWVPVLAGRTIPARQVVLIASLGALATTVYGAMFVYTTLNAELAGEPWATWLVNILYLPLLAWGPLLGAVTWHYHRRRGAQRKTRALPSEV